jgi:pilus assembly protein CpaC
MHYRWLKVFILSILLCSMFVLPVFAFEKLEVAVNTSRIINLNGVERVAVASPEIADVVVISSTEVLLVGKSTGTTTMHVWSRKGRSSYTVNVTGNEQRIANEIEKTLGLTNIKVMKTGKTIIIEGKVHDSYQKNRVELMASAYGDKVINLVEIVHPLQVKIEAKIIEIDKTKVNNLGVTWGSSVSSPGAFTFGQSSTNKIASAALGKLGTYDSVNAELDLLAKDGLVKILSQPNMVTISGEKASIMVGGSIPLPMTNDNGKISFSFTDYGIKLDIEPTVTSEGLINSKITAEVSSIDWTSSHKLALGDNISVPPMNKNQAHSVIVLGSGQTMAIGGLLSSTQSKDIIKVPLLGDLPIIGALFRSEAFSKDQTEMIIMVTPTIVDNIDNLQNDSSVEMNNSIEEFKKKKVIAQNDKTVKKDVAVQDDKAVKKDATVQDDKAVKKDATVQDDKTVKKDVAVQDDKTVKKDVAVQDDKAVKKDVAVQDDKTVKKDVAVQDDKAVKKDVTVQDDKTVKKAVMEILKDNTMKTTGS